MRKVVAAVWLVFTLLPFAYFAYFIVYMMNMWGIDSDRDFQQQQAQFDLLFKVHLGAMALILFLIATYVVYLFKTECVPKDKKALWAVVLFMGGVFAMPVFWFIHVWKPLRSVKSAEQSVQPDRREDAAPG